MRSGIRDAAYRRLVATGGTALRPGPYGQSVLAGLRCRGLDLQVDCQGLCKKSGGAQDREALDSTQA